MLISNQSDALNLLLLPQLILYCTTHSVKKTSSGKTTPTSVQIFNYRYRSLCRWADTDDDMCSHTQPLVCGWHCDPVSCEIISKIYFLHVAKWTGMHTRWEFKGLARSCEDIPQTSYFLSKQPPSSSKVPKCQPTCFAPWYKSPPRFTKEGRFYMDMCLRVCAGTTSYIHERRRWKPNDWWVWRSQHVPALWRGFCLEVSSGRFPCPDNIRLFRHFLYA